MKKLLKLSILALGIAAQCAFGQTSLTTVSDSAVRTAAGQGLFSGRICFTSPPMVFNSTTYAANSQPSCVTVTNGVFPATQFVPNGVTGVVAAGYNDFYTALWRNSAGNLIRTEMWVVPPSTVSLKIYQVQKSTLTPILTYLLTTKGDDIGCCGVDGFAVRIPVGADNSIKVADSSQTYGWSWKTVDQILGFTVEPAITGGASNQYWTGSKTWATLNTTAVPEGTRVYHTPERVRASVTATLPIVFDALTGTFSCPTCGTSSATGDTTAPASNTDLYFPRWAGSNTKTLSDGLQATGNGNRLVTSTGTRIPNNLALWDASGNAIDSTLPYTSVILSSLTYADPSWITSLAKSKVGLGNVENTALSTWAGSSNITALGTIASGAVPYSLVTGKPTTFPIPSVAVTTTTYTMLSANKGSWHNFHGAAGSAWTLPAATSTFADYTTTIVNASNNFNVTLTIGSGNEICTNNTAPATCGTSIVIPARYNLKITADTQAPGDYLGVLSFNGPAGSGSGDLLSTNNLSDLVSAPTARTNLGLGDAAVKNTGSTAGTLAAGDDSRLSNARTPTTHATSHQNGGADEIATATPGANVIPKAGAGGTLNASFIPTLNQNTTGTAGGFTSNGANCSATNEAAAGVSATGVAEGCRPTPQIFFGTTTPGSVSGNLPGDLFSDTTNHNWYGCNAVAATAAPACTSVTTNGWQLLNGGGSGSGNAASKVPTTFGTTMTFTCPSSSAGTIVTFIPTTALTANVTATSLSGCGTNGQILSFAVTQDATGRTLAYPTGFDNIPAISSVPSSSTNVTVSWDGTIARLIGYSTSGAGDLVVLPEQSPGTLGISGAGVLFTETDHLPYLRLNGGTKDRVCTLSAGCGAVGNGFYGTKALATSALTSGTCSSAQTATATGLTTADVILASFNADPTSTTGYSPATTGQLYIAAYPTADTVNFKTCNSTSASVTPDAASLNWVVLRSNITVVGGGVKTLNTTLVATGTCGTAQTLTISGTATTDVIVASFASDPTGVTGYIPATTGSLGVVFYPTSNTVNFKVCNNTGSDITPGAALDLNVKVVH